MSDGPRSQVLLAEFVTTGPYSRGFTCPAAHTTLVKSAYVSNQSSVEQLLELQIFFVGGQEGFRIHEWTLPSGSAGEWEGWTVLDPGMTVICHGPSGSFYILCSGAVLFGEPAFPPGTDILG